VELLDLDSSLNAAKVF